eukprot:5100723-Amphidinium_carterae.1
MHLQEHIDLCPVEAALARSMGPRSASMTSPQTAVEATGYSSHKEIPEEQEAMVIPDDVEQDIGKPPPTKKNKEQEEGTTIPIKPPWARSREALGPERPSS